MFTERHEERHVGLDSSLKALRGLSTEDLWELVRQGREAKALKEAQEQGLVIDGKGSIVDAAHITREQ